MGISVVKFVMQSELMYVNLLLTVQQLIEIGVFDFSFILGRHCDRSV